MRALKWMGLALGLFVAAAAIARDKAPAEPLPPLDSVLLMPLEGSLAIDAEGKVTEVRIDTRAPDNLRAGVERIVREWRFQPELVDGVAQPAHADMRVVLAARPVGDAYQARIDSVTFRRPADVPRGDDPHVVVSVRKLVPPNYPQAAVLEMLDGSVLAAVRVDRDGRAVDVAILQSAVYDVRGRPVTLGRALGVFETAVRKAALDWQFEVALVAGREPTADDLTVVVPVRFIAGKGENDGLGQWRATVRSPRRTAPWVSPDPRRLPMGVADVAGSAPQPVAGALQLLSDPAAGGAL